jgi:uncharacterized lipoprotein YbaY
MPTSGHDEPVPAFSKRFINAFTTSADGGLAVKLLADFADQSADAKSCGSANALGVNMNDKAISGTHNTRLHIVSSPPHWQVVADGVAKRDRPSVLVGQNSVEQAEQETVR